MTKVSFKNDKFKKIRGGYSRWLLISCEKCSTPQLIYQKDGPGLLKRLYFDRITIPQLPSKKNLICKKCKTILGIPIIYHKEKRGAHRLFSGAVTKKLININKLGKFKF